MTSCIYCGTNAAKSVEHHLPFALGNFKGYRELKDKVCGICNSSIGKAEGSFLRSSDVGINRQFFSISGRKRKKTENPFYSPSYGTQQIDITAVDPWDGKVKKWELKDRGITQLEALYIIKKDGTKLTVPLDPNIKSVEDLKNLLVKNHLSNSNVEQVEIEVSQERAEKIQCFVTTFFKTGIFEWRDDREFIPMIVQPQVRITLKTVDYFRSIAKIGFHYLLTYCDFFTGNETPFYGIKDFIFSGCDPKEIEKFVVKCKFPILYEMQQGKLPDHVGHLIIADLKPDRILVHVHLFISCQLFGLPPTIPYTVFIGRNPQRIHCDYSVGHFFYYYNAGKVNGYHGEMINVNSLYAKKI